MLSWIGWNKTIWIKMDMAWITYNGWYTIKPNQIKPKPTQKLTLCFISCLRQRLLDEYIYIWFCFFIHGVIVISGGICGIIVIIGGFCGVIVISGGIWWCNDYLHGKWTWWPKFKSWMKQFAFPLTPIPFRKVFHPSILLIARAGWDI